MEQSVPVVFSPTIVHDGIFARVPPCLRDKLANELGYVQNPSLILTNYLFERRRLFQDLLYRYFRQIVYGCKNPRCNSPTCLSYQKRISKGPFRELTNLSAWTLATFLATQEKAERGLCANEPVTVQHGKGKFLGSKDVDQTPMSTAVGLETPPQHDGVSGKTKSPNKKDFKSFTQNLFDTVPMKQLQLMKVPEGLSEWRLGRNAVEGAVSIEDRNGAIRMEKRQNGDELRFGDLLQPEILYHEKISEAGESQSSEATLHRQGADMKSFMPGPWNFVNKRFRSIFNLPDSALTDSGSQSQSEFGRNYRKIDAAFTRYVSALSAQGSRSEFTETLYSFVNNNQDCPFDDRSPTLPVAANSRQITPPQSLSRFTLENLEALSTSFEIFNPKIPYEQKSSHTFNQPASHVRLDSMVSGTASRGEREIAFLSQSIIFVLSSPDSLIKSFRDPDSELENSKYEYEFLKIIYAFTLLFKVDILERCVFSSLRNSANKLHPPKHYHSENTKPNKSLSSEPLASNTRSEKSPTKEKAINDVEAMHIAKIALAALIARVTKGKGYGNAWVSFCEAHAQGRAIYQDTQLQLMDIFDDELCIELMAVLVRAMVVRKYMSKITGHREPQLTTDENLHVSSENIINKLLQNVFHMSPSGGIMAVPVAKKREISGYHAEILLQWLRSVILRNWDGKALVQRWGAVGCALDFMSYLCLSDNLDQSITADNVLVQMSGHLGINPSSFESPFLFEQLDIKQFPGEWLLSNRDRNRVHLLSFPFLFSRQMLVSYFRAINHAGMLKAYNDSVAAEKLAESLDFTERGNYVSRFGKFTNKFLVLELRRENVLTDAMNELWRRERYELMRPLTVYIGGQGEEGVDQGGVQQEFMRIATSESMRPDYGLFTTDDQTQMSWFQPFALEPLYKFELLGLITSLAVYNGLTVPVTFPLALYRKLLSLPVTRPEHIRDGWPSLAKGLQDLLDWTVGSVENVFAISYGFSVEAFGKTIEINLGEIESDGDWPSSQRSSRSTVNSTDTHIDAASGCTSSKPEPRTSSASSQPSAGRNDESMTFDYSGEGSSCGSARESLGPPKNSIASQRPCTVTNENRSRYVEDYIFWLTDKSVRSQYEAFARGFFTCIEPKAISIFTPEDLKSVIEGIQDINVDELWHTATYDNGYSPTHRVIEDFWHVVRDLSPAQLRQLFEFVTASDRVPAKGLSSIQFVIQKNGDSDERLPTSITCFGKLLLPEYSSRSILKERLCVAIEHCKGFGLS